MNNDKVSRDEGSKGVGFLRWLGRLVIIAIILMIVSYLTPGFSIRGLWSFLIAALVITVLDYIVERIIKIDASPFTKGIKGFIIAVLIIYFSQFLVPHMNVTILGSILGALVIGVIDAIFPVRVM